MTMAGEECYGSSLIARRLYRRASGQRRKKSGVIHERTMQVVLSEGSGESDNPEGSKDCVSQKLAFSPCGISGLSADLWMDR